MRQAPEAIAKKVYVQGGDEGQDCAGCEGDIAPGQVCVELTVPFEGDLYAWHYHPVCLLLATPNGAGGSA